jgi:sporulation-control protein spo0M
VAYTTDGTTYEKLTAAKVENVENTYSFTLGSDVALANVKIAVALRGDLDLSGKVDSTDAKQALRADAGIRTLTSLEFLIADIDDSNKVDSTDAKQMLRVEAGVRANFDW